MELEVVKLLAYNTFVRGKEMFEKLLSLRVEIIVTFFAGVLSVLTAAMCYKSIHLQSVRLVVIGQVNSDVIGINCFLLVVLGLASILLAVMKFNSRLHLSFNQFLLVVVLTLAGNFLIGVMFSEYKRVVIESLDDGMRLQFNMSLSLRKHSAGFHHLVDAWDTVQIKLSCCGIYGYKDYINFWPKSTGIATALPTSCCSLKNMAAAMSIDGVKQCHVDAVIEVVHSVFLNTEGCYGPIQRWLIHMINKIMYLIYITACFQGFTVLYLCFIGYKEMLRK